MRKYNFSLSNFSLSPYFSLSSYLLGGLVAFLSLLVFPKNEKCDPIKIITTDSSTVITQKSKIMSLEKALKDKEIENTLLITKLKQQSQVKATTKIIEKKIPIYTQKVIIIDTNTFDSIDFIRVPYTLYYEDSFTFFKGTIDPLDFTLDSLIIKNELVVSVGDKKSKWWGKNEPYVEVKSTNPNTEIKVKSVEIKQKKHFYKTFWFGAVVGSIVSAILIL
jgi:hypothetical protein